MAHKREHKPIWIQETFVNATEGYQFGESRPFESDFYQDEIGQLFRSLSREYGRCMSKVYVERNGKDGIPVGWVFQKRMEYEDSARLPRAERFYIREVWVHCFESEPFSRIVQRDLQVAWFDPRTVPIRHERLSGYGWRIGHKWHATKSRIG